MCYSPSSLLVCNHIVVKYLGLISHLNFFGFILQSLGCSIVFFWQINEAFSTCYFLSTKVFICSSQVTSQSERALYVAPLQGAMDQRSQDALHRLWPSPGKAVVRTPAPLQ